MSARRFAGTNRCGLSAILLLAEQWLTEGGAIAGPRVCHDAVPSACLCMSVHVAAACVYGVLQILDQCQRLRLQGWSHTVEASCMELYGNTLRDLLAVSTSGGSGAADNTAACGGIFDQNAIKHDSEGEALGA